MRRLVTMAALSLALATPVLAHAQGVNGLIGGPFAANAQSISGAEGSMLATTGGAAHFDGVAAASTAAGFSATGLGSTSTSTEALNSLATGNAGVAATFANFGQSAVTLTGGENAQFSIGGPTF